MEDRSKLLVMIRRISTLFETAFRNGPDGSLEGKFAKEHPTFIHYSNALYLAGCLGYLESEEGAFAWTKPGESHKDFDEFASSNPPKKDSYTKRGISKASLNAMAEVRNAVIHNNGDLSKNRNGNSVRMVSDQNFPGLVLKGTTVILEREFMEFVRVSTYAVKSYHGES